MIDRLFSLNDGGNQSDFCLIFSVKVDFISCSSEVVIRDSDKGLLVSHCFHFL